MTRNIPVCVPKLPLAEQIFPYLQKIDKNRWYSNYGPLIVEFMTRFANLFNCERPEIICSTNGTELLELTLRALGVKKDSLCIMPAWTFVATPLAALNAHMQPFFVDIDLKTQAINPTTLIRDLDDIRRHGDIGAVIVVSPFGMPVNTQDWDNFTEQTGIPVIIDAAAGFDSALQLEEMQIRKSPVMISLHATKVMGIGEGAVLLSKNTELIAEVECLTQFGFPKGIRNSVALGTNAKLSEYSGAVGLAALDHWQDTRREWKIITQAYQKTLDERNIAHMLSSEWVPSTCNVILPYQADFIGDELYKQGISARKWWGDGCHQQQALNIVMHTDLANTEYLVQSVLGLPFYIGMDTDIISTIVDAVDDLLEHERKIQHAS